MTLLPWVDTHFENWHRFIQRYNIWQKSHLDLPCGTPELAQFTGPTVDADINGTADQCQGQGAPAGSQCDLFVPDSAGVKFDCTPGAKVRAGETVLGTY